MTRKSKFRMGICLVAGLMAGAMVAEARPAPDFTLTDLTGKSHTLADYKGKFVVLEWTNPECPFVKKHYGSSNMPKLQASYAEKGVVWLSISSSAMGKQGHHTVEEWSQIQTDQGAIPAATLLDPEGTVGHAYGAKTTPHMFVINPEGEIVYEGAIDDKPTWKPEDVEGAQNYVSAALDAAMAGEPVAVASTASYGCSVKY
ncbi:MAG: thioredoxin family protein [Verrucomicrobia bacterium]|nr:thioredoxin family protein [Verrucomicrobiota bacterium]